MTQVELTDKGLAHDSVGLLGSVVLALSSVAPAYALTATLGPTVTEVGVQMPAVFLIGFLPMLLVAYAYRGLNQRIPDAGTSFTWTVKAFGPHVGWMCGWGLVIATIIVLSNLAGVAVTFFYLLIAEIVGQSGHRDLGRPQARQPRDVPRLRRDRDLHRVPRDDGHEGRHVRAGDRAAHRAGTVRRLRPRQAAAMRPARSTSAPRG